MKLVMVNESVSRDSATQPEARGVVNKRTSGSVKSIRTQLATCRALSVNATPLLTMVVGGQFVPTARSIPLKIGVQGLSVISARSKVAWAITRIRAIGYFMNESEYQALHSCRDRRKIHQNGQIERAF